MFPFGYQRTVPSTGEVDPQMAVTEVSDGSGRVLLVPSSALAVENRTWVQNPCVAGDRPACPGDNHTSA
jgi:hypothetical protein